MKIQVNTDASINGTESLAEKVISIVEPALARFTQNITRVEVHLSDENARKKGPQDYRCMLESRLEGRQPVAVTDHADGIEQSVIGAAAKMARLLDSTFGRLHAQRDRAHNVAQPADDAAVE